MPRELFSQSTKCSRASSLLQDYVVAVLARMKAPVKRHSFGQNLALPLALAAYHQAPDNQAQQQLDAILDYFVEQQLVQIQDKHITVNTADDQYRRLSTLAHLYEVNAVEAS